MTQAMLLGVLFLPVLAGVVSSWRYVKEVPLVCMLVAAGMSILLAYQHWNDAAGGEYHWFSLGAQEVSLSYLLTPWALALLAVVNIISFLVHLFSTHYMRDDLRLSRYFGVLGLFTFSMSALVVSGNLLVTFMCWELVGVASYLLIGHWWHKEQAARAAKKAFIFNRVGDLGFITGLALCWHHYQTFELVHLVNASPLEGMSGIWLGLCFFIGAIGKSAQFPLLLWLPDAMEGPTPVSALIHAATMVAAGVYLLIRVEFLFAPPALDIVLIVGAITALLGAFAALTQHDIKKVLAYSTISQLGYMMAGFGAGSPWAAGFHLFTHAFFKAGLFLAAASVIDHLHQVSDHHTDVQDMRNMGGLGKKLPVTYLTYTVFAFSLMGVPLFSGFLSKDAILLALWSAASSGELLHVVALVCALVSVGLTAFYMMRQWQLVFHGDSQIRTEGMRESSPAYKVVLIVLAVASTAFVWSVNPISLQSVWLTSLGELQGLEYGLVVAGVAIALTLAGGLLGYFRYRKGSPIRSDYLGDAPTDLICQLSFHNSFLDKLYHKGVQQSVLAFSRITARVDRKIIDGAVNAVGVSGVAVAQVVGWLDRHIIDGAVNTTAHIVRSTGAVTRSVQGGKIQTYISLAVLGLLIIIFLALR